MSGCGKMRRVDHDLGTLAARTVTRDISVWESPTFEFPFGRFVQSPVAITEIDLSGAPVLRDGDRLSFSYELAVE